MQTFLRLEFFQKSKLSHQNPKNVLTDGIYVILFVQMIRMVTQEDGDAATVPRVTHITHYATL